MKLKTCLDSVIEQAEDLRTALDDGRLVFPDGEKAGMDELLSLVGEADDLLDTACSYYIGG